MSFNNLGLFSKMYPYFLQSAIEAEFKLFYMKSLGIVYSTNFQYLSESASRVQIYLVQIEMLCTVWRSSLRR